MRISLGTQFAGVWFPGAGRARAAAAARAIYGAIWRFAVACPAPGARARVRCLAFELEPILTPWQSSPVAPCRTINTGHAPELSSTASRLQAFALSKKDLGL
jgi:hypothetical protein